MVTRRVAGSATSTTGAGGQPGQRLVMKLRIGVSRRDYLDGEIRRTGPISEDAPDTVGSLTPDEGGIGSPHCVRIARQDKASLGGKPAAGVVRLDVALQQRRNMEGDGPGLGAGRRHLAQLAFNELEAAIVARQPQQLLGAQRNSGQRAGRVRGHRATPRP